MNRLSRLRGNNRGNVLPIVAAAVLPLIGMIGSGVDMGRGYVAQSRLQQACDAGVLAARKKLGSSLPPSQEMVAEIQETGNEFFNLNFEDGRYDSQNREFVMTLESDYAISGEASIDLPTAIMGIFGFNSLPIDVECQSRINFTNLDIMMVLDVTGSMRHTNDSDTMPRIDVMRSVVRGFRTSLDDGKTPDTRLRFGFVPYSTNVNVGHLLRDEWVADEWTYQSRMLDGVTTNDSTRTRNANWRRESGQRQGFRFISEYEATYQPATPGSDPGLSDAAGGSGTAARYVCDGGQPARDMSISDTLLSEKTEPYTGPPIGTRKIEYRRRISDGIEYRTRRVGTQCIVESREFIDYTETYERITEPTQSTQNNWLYKALSYDVSNWRVSTPGCIEERRSSVITDFDNVDLSINQDLDINTIPSSLNSDSQWRPHYPQHVWTRAIRENGTGSLSPADVRTTTTYAKTGGWWLSACPAPARKLAEMDDDALDTYLSKLEPEGATYHDIGMIWGGRLLSPKGLFASDNADVSDAKPTKRHLIFLTDGQTEPFDLSYGAYGVEPLDQRRWSPTSPRSLHDTIQERFKFACNEVKKNNITVWIIAFGTDANEAMIECAGNGRYFTATDAGELDESFRAIARSMGDLRISQ